MQAYQLGTEEAFEELYRRYAGRVFGFLKSKTRDEALAQDIFQSTFLKLHRSRASYNSMFPFLPWLFTICRSEMLDAFRKKARTKEDSVEAIYEIKIDEANEVSQLDLSSLPPKQKEALELRFQQGLSFEEIATRLQTGTGNARQLVSRAVRFLRGLYGGK